MLFSSFTFALFLFAVFVLHWFVFKTDVWRNRLLLVASYLFYGWWDWRFLTLIIFSSAFNFGCAKLLEMHKNPGTRKRFFVSAVLVNLAILGYFKYAAFFVQSFIAMLAGFGFRVEPVSLQIVLPVGISFFTFQTLSYTIDVYKRRMAHTDNWEAFFTYVAFFPQLVAGPIERASHLLPQFLRHRSFCYEPAIDGLKQFAWGLFKKVVVADGLAWFVEDIFARYQTVSGATLLLGAFYFSIQIYADFSGYSDMAIGMARLFGIDIMQNFRIPWLAKDIRDYWHRWHISLSTWFRDYVYIPLGGSKLSKIKTFRNLIITFVVSGLWHGANFTFMAWGFLHGLAMIVNSYLGSIKIGNGWFGRFLSWAFTFVFVILLFVFFRSGSVSQAVGIIDRIFSFETWHYSRDMALRHTLLLFVPLMATEYLTRNFTHPFRAILHWPQWLRMAAYFGVCFFVVFNSGNITPFIYFQF